MLVTKFHSVAFVRVALVSIPLLVATTSSVAAELGDINDDGRVSFGDAYLYDQWWRGSRGDAPPAAGSADFAAHFACTPNTLWGELLYHESLRRTVERPLAHFIERWPDPSAAQAEPPPPDDRVRLAILASTHRSDRGTIELSIGVETAVTLDAMAVVLGAGGVELRPQTPPRPNEDRPGPLRSETQYTILTRGRAVYRSRLSAQIAITAPGTTIRIVAEVPAGTPAGDYSIEFLDGTEVVTADGEVLRPVVVAGTLRLTTTIIDGHPAFPFAPLDLVDAENRRIEGGVELRAVPRTAAGFPGDEIIVDIQVKVDRPVNHLPFILGLDGRVLAIEEVVPVLESPETGEVDASRFEWMHFFNGRAPFESLASITASYDADRSVHAKRPYSDRDQPGLDYVRPLGEWVDFVRARIVILPTARSGPTPLHFDLSHFTYGWKEPVFSPYAPRPETQIWSTTDCIETGAFWEHEATIYHDGEITVFGGDETDPDPPIDPAAANIRFEIGDAAGEPGETVRLPVTVTTGVDLYQLRVALHHDATLLELAGFEVAIADAGGVLSTRTLTAEEFGITSLACAGEFPNRVCAAGFPILAVLHGEPRDSIPNPSETTIVDLTTTYLFGEAYGGTRSWVPRTRHEIGALYFRIRDDAPDGVAEIIDTVVEWTPESSVGAVRSRSSGFPILGDAIVARSDVPAVSVRRGVVLIGNPGFVRADTNGNGLVELSDAIAVLDALFRSTGTVLSCADAADANDDGSLNVSDPVFALGFLFLGGSPPPPPFPLPGADPTADPLGCARTLDGA